MTNHPVNLTGVLPPKKFEVIRRGKSSVVVDKYSGHPIGWPEPEDAAVMTCRELNEAAMQGAKAVEDALSTIKGLNDD